MIRFAPVILLCTTLWAQHPDPREIVLKSVQLDDRDSKLRNDYTFLQRNVVRDGKSAKDETHEVFFFGGKTYRKLVQRDGKPLSESDQQAEQAKLDANLAKDRQRSAAEVARDAARHERTRARERESLKDIPEAYNFTLLREEEIGARPAYVLQAEPRKGYSGKHQALLSKIHGKIWIDKADYHWVRAEAESLETISFGLFLARLAKGSHLEFEQTRINDEIWLPRRIAVTASARLALVRKLSVNQEAIFSNYKKFQAESKILSTTEIQDSK